MDINREIVANVSTFGDSSYSQFGSDITILSGESGDSRTCFVDKNVLDSDGKYIQGRSYCREPQYLQMKL